MKKLILLIAVLAVAACKQEQPPRDYAVIHGNIGNPTPGLDFRLYNPETSESVTIKVDTSGNFRDTLKLKQPVYYNAVYNNVFNLYVANGMDLEINFDGNKISETLAFSGAGSAENNFLQYKSKKCAALMGEDYREYLGMETGAFNVKTAAYSQDLMDNLNDANKGFDTTFVASEKEHIAQFEKDIKLQHQQQLEINEALGKGKASPQFSEYINYKGGTSSLSDFKGKYIYIDVWATWCVPCVYEMPYMNEIEKEYEGKNIHFIGISIDRKKDDEKWRKMIVDKALMGTQLLADNEIDSKFIQDYYIQGIPRFILLDPELNIISYDAPRPSDPALKALFESLNL
jgi:thiol-disulfide isomerase/thioredoxin